MILTPDYLSLDFNTALEKLKSELKKSDTFKDYNYNGSNISILMELMSYFSDLNTFFSNKMFKNVFSETSDIYECVNRLSRQKGYEPKGKRSGRATINLTIDNIHVGDIIKVYPWKQFDSGRLTESEEQIKYSTISTTEGISTGTSHTIEVPIKQGEVLNLTGFTGEDLIDNELILPSDYAYDNEINDTNPSIQLSVNGVIWNRISDFFNEIDPLTNEDNVYMFIYDKYERNKISFNSTRNVPEKSDIIEITALKSLGVNGSIGADSDEEWTFDNTKNVEINYNNVLSFIDNDSLSLSLTAASIGASDPETIAEIKNNSQSNMHSQFRNITSTDYISHLTERSDIIMANAWGEQEISPSGGSIQEYNKVHLSTIPNEWNNSTIQTSASNFTTNWGTSASIMLPSEYSNSWSNELKIYLLPRKMMTSYEVFSLPELVYFSFKIGIRINRLYVFSNVKQDVLDKLIYYFRSANQNFNSIINFNDISEYILDLNNISSDNNYLNILGIRNLNIRDINTSKIIYESNQQNNFPYWADSQYVGENQLRRIQLGYNQFPILSSDTTSIIEEI